MKFNFEKAKNFLKISALVTGTALITSSSNQEKDNSTDNNVNAKLSETNISSNTDAYSEMRPQTIDWNEAVLHTNNNEMLEQNENDTILTKIENLEKKFSKLSQEKTEILKGSVSLVSNYQLDEISDTSMQDGVYNSPLINIHIMNLLENYAVNNLGDMKVLPKDDFSLMAIDETENMAKADYINLNDNGYKHYLPEKYIYIEQNNSDSTALFKIIVFSSTDKKIIASKELSFEIPKGDKIHNDELVKVVDENIIPRIGQEIKTILQIINKI